MILAKFHHVELTPPHCKIHTHTYIQTDGDYTKHVSFQQSQAVCLKMLEMA